MSVSGSRSRQRRKSIKRSRLDLVKKAVEPSITADPEATERLSVLADDETWARAGVELRRVDPKRFLAILKVVEDICSIHRDPLGEIVSDGFYVFPKGKSDQFD